MPKPLVEPAPPIVHDELRHIGCGLRFAESPTEFLRELRDEYGDTYLLDVFGYPLFCVFSPTGLKSLYDAAEDEASFGMATFDLLGFKTPTEIFIDTDIDLFYELLKPDRNQKYIDDFNDVLDEALPEWPEQGEIELFDTIRTLEQRIGFQCWIGSEAAEDWQSFKPPFDALSQEFAFVSPQKTLHTIKSNKRAEREALNKLYQMLREIHDARLSHGNRPDDTLSFLYDRFANDDAEALHRKVAHNTINANQGFLSNLYAALAWVLINLHTHPDVLAKTRAEIDAIKDRYGADFTRDSEALDQMTYMEQVLMESVRYAQRSLTLRKVLKPTQFDDGSQTYQLAPGVYIATMLSVTNRDSPELSHFDPDHYSGRRLKPALVAKGKETVSTFGHGKHACPAQRFSHNMCKVLISRLLNNFQFSQPNGDLSPSNAQMGGVARTDSGTYLSFRRAS